MTTIAYDGNFIVSDSYFTDENGVSDERLELCKLRIISNIVIGVSGDSYNLGLISDDIYTQINTLILEKSPLLLSGGLPNIQLSDDTVASLNDNFKLILWQNNNCQLITKQEGILHIDDITGNPTVIGSGTSTIRGLNVTKSNAFYCVAEGIENDPYSGGKLLYVNLKNVNYNNLQIKEFNALGEPLAIRTTMNDTAVIANKDPNMTNTRLNGKLKPGESVAEAMARGCFPPPVIIKDYKPDPIIIALAKYSQGLPLTPEEVGYVEEFAYAKYLNDRTKEIVANNPGLSC